MKHVAITSVLALTTAALFAGEPTYVEAAPKNPLPQPTLWNWFIGGGVGYLLDTEEEMYSAHVGIDLQQPVNGWSQAVYLEIGYFNVENSFLDDHHDYDVRTAITGEVSSAGKGRSLIRADLDVIPITLNYKVERPISGPLSGYLGAGVGIALLDLELTDGKSTKSDDDTTFYGQVFAGLLYNASESYELYAGGRWIYIDGATLFKEKVESLDDFVVEVGARFNF